MKMHEEGTGGKHEKGIPIVVDQFMLDLRNTAACGSILRYFEHVRVEGDPRWTQVVTPLWPLKKNLPDFRCPTKS